MRCIFFSKPPQRIDVSILVALLVISFLIFFHELGHFVAARFFGVHVERFSVGFGRALVSKTISGTRYTLSAIPLGGFVQMKGQDDSDPTKVSNDPDSYNALAPWQRICILFAGPFANFLIAFVLYLFVAFIGVQQLTATVGQVNEGSPAARAGLQKDDKIVAINNEKIVLWKDMSSAITGAEGTLTLKIARDGTVQTIQVKPQILQTQNLFGESVKRKMIGIAPSGDTITTQMGAGQALAYAYDKTADAMLLIAKSIQKLIQGVVGADQIGGVVSIVQFSAQATEAGIVTLFMFTALISVNLGILNLLPIPALDGGHILFNLYEIIMRRPPSQQALYSLTLAGWGFLISLMTLGLYNDINRIMGG